MPAYPWPFPPPPGQAVSWALPGTSDWGAESGPGTTAPNGNADSTLTTGRVEMTHSSGTANSTFLARWYDFVMPNLPAGATIANIYAVAEAKYWDTFGVFDNSYDMGASPNPFTSWAAGAPGTVTFGPSINHAEPANYETVYSGSLGSTESVVTNGTMFARFNETLVINGDGILEVINPRFAIYYTAEIMPIGHGANCNDYDPITLSDGATSAPGNGLLIS